MDGDNNDVDDVMAIFAVGTPRNHTLVTASTSGGIVAE